MKKIITTSWSFSFASVVVLLPDMKPIIFWKSLPEALLRGCSDSCACASSSRLVQHLSSAESAGARSMDPLRITHRAVLSGTDGFLTDCCKDISTEKQWTRSRLRVFNAEERGASDSWSVLIFFLPSAPTRKLTFFLGLIPFSKGIPFVAFTYFSTLYYMWILIRDYGRLRVPRQA